MAGEQLRFETYAHLPEIQAAALRVMVLESADSRIDVLPDWVRFRIADAARTLDECHERIKALELYVECIQKADCKAFAKLAKRYKAMEHKHGR